MAAITLPPAVGALVAAGGLVPPEAVVPSGASVPDEVASSSSPPQAAMIAPMNGIDRPMIVPRLTKLRRLI